MPHALVQTGVWRDVSTTHLHGHERLRGGEEALEAAVVTGIRAYDQRGLGVVRAVYQVVKLGLENRVQSIDAGVGVHEASTGLCRLRPGTHDEADHELFDPAPRFPHLHPVKGRNTTRAADTSSSRTSPGSLRGREGCG